MPEEPPKDLLEAIANGRALVVCGAGVSRAATEGKAPDWAQLIKDALTEAATSSEEMSQPWVKACQQFLASNEVGDWLTAANTIQAKLGGPAGGPYRAFFVKKLGSLKATRPDILQALVKIAGAENRIATTNYDHLVAEALHWDRADWSNHLRVIEALRNDRPAVWHVHGDFDQPVSIVFSQNDYDRITESVLPQFVQHSAGLGFTLVFVGCSGSGLSDDNVGGLLDWMHKGFAGLGDKHFVLVTDSNTDTWPNGVTQVRFGNLDDLPAYLAALAPGLLVSSTLPPDPKMIGRARRLEELVDAILNQERSVIVPGALGMGKTTLALAAAHDARVIRRFGEGRRIFVNLEPVSDAEGLLRRLAAGLGMNPSGLTAEVEAKIAAASATHPALVILDNLESPLLKDRGATEALLGRLATIEGVRFVITVRGETPHIYGPGALTLRDVEQLTGADALDLFLRHAGRQFAADPALPDLLRALDGHPLSIELLAAKAAGLTNLSGLAADWNHRRADMLQRGAADDRLTSLRTSLDISLAALHPPSAAHRLIRVMALLPDGMFDADTRMVLNAGEPTKEERAGAGRLETARLARRSGGRWRLLAPVRELLLADFPPDADDRARLTKLFLERAALGKRIGTAGWAQVREAVLGEAGNLDAMIGVAANEPASLDGLRQAVEGLASLYRFAGLASVASLPGAAARFKSSGDLLGEANCVYSLGHIALGHTDQEAARDHFRSARSLYRRIGYVPGEADCIWGLGSLAALRSDHNQACQQFEAALLLYKSVGGVLGQANCIQSLGNIALVRTDHELARQHFEEAQELHRQVGDLLGEANCVQSQASIALVRSSHEAARELFGTALKLFRQVGGVLGEANCIKGLGDIALARSDHDAANQHFSAALVLYQGVGAALGEANCIKSLGDIAFRVSDHEIARQQFDMAAALYVHIGDVRGEAACIQRLGDIARLRFEYDNASKRFEGALLLYRRVGDVQGEANSVFGLAHIDFARSDHKAAHLRLEAAKSLYERAGDVLGEANCIQSLGHIALASSDLETARQRFDTALPLYKQFGDALGEANCIQGVGDINRASGAIADARERWYEALALFIKIPEPYSIGCAHIRLAGCALTSDEAAHHREAARRAWELINRPDLNQTVPFKGA